MNHEPFVAFVRELAEASAQVILPYFGSRDMGLEIMKTPDESRMARV